MGRRPLQRRTHHTQLRRILSVRPPLPTVRASQPAAPQQQAIVQETCGVTGAKAVYRPAVLRANRLTPTAKLAPDQSFHSLRHTYASLCVAAGIRPIDIAALMSHRDVKTTLTVYAHLINTDDHTGNMAALGVLEAGSQRVENVVPLWA